MIREYLAHRLEENRRLCLLLDGVTSAWAFGWTWDPGCSSGTLSALVGSSPHYQYAVLEAWLGQVAVDLCKRQGFRGGTLLDIHAPQKLLVSLQVRERDRMVERHACCGSMEWSVVSLRGFDHYDHRFSALAALFIKAEVRQASERRELAHWRDGFVVLGALAPALYLLDAGGSATTEGRDGNANVLRTACADSRIGAIVQTCHGRVPHP